MKKNEKKKNEQTIHNLIILDESGSMDSIRQAALSGANETIRTIRKAQEAMPQLRQRLTFVTFDQHGDGKDVRTIIDDEPIEKVRDLTEKDYAPNGCTPLYDAMGMSLNALQPKVKADEHVLVTIITDGYENASHEYSGMAIKSIVGLLREKGWKFVYIGANQDAVEVATGLNIDQAINYEANDADFDRMICEENAIRCSFYTELGDQFQKQMDESNEFFFF